jgi:hypothetical protein
MWSYMGDLLTSVNSFKQLETIRSRTIPTESRFTSTVMEPLAHSLSLEKPLGVLFSKCH